MTLPSRTKDHGSDEPLVTRRQTLWILAGTAAMLSLPGCGGGGSDAPTGRLSLTSGRAMSALPSGLTIPVSELKGETAFSSNAVGSDGAFATRVRTDGGPTLAWLRHERQNKFVLFGFANGGESGVSAKGSAVALLALALGIGGLAGEPGRQLVTLLENHAATTTLANVIARRVAASPYALSDGDAEIRTATQTALAAISTGNGSSTSKASRGRAEEFPAIMSITPGEQSQANVLQKDAPTTIYPTNLGRRPISVLTYKTSYETEGGVVNLPQAVPVGSREDLPATTGLLGSLASLGSNPAYAPVEGRGLGLEMQEGAKKTTFETIVLMASGKTENEGEPSFFSEAKYASQVAEWRTRREQLNIHTWMSGIVFDIVASVIGGIATYVSYSAVLAAIAKIEAAGGAAASEFLALAAKGDFGRSTYLLMERLVGTDIAANRSRAAIAELVLGAEGASASAIGASTHLSIMGVAALVAGTLAVTGTIVALADIGFTYKDVVTSEKAARWTETLLKPNVSLGPPSTTLAAGGNVDLTVSTVGANEGNFRFKWKLTGGGNGVIGEKGAANAGKEITTDTRVVNLLTAPSDVKDTIYTVTVEAVEKASNRSLGIASATVKIRAAAPVPVNVEISFITGPALPGFQTVDVATFEVKDDNVYTVSYTGYPGSEYAGERVSFTFAESVLQREAVGTAGVFQAFPTSLIAASHTTIKPGRLGMGFRGNFARPDLLETGSTSGVTWNPENSNGTVYHLLTGERLDINTEEQAEAYLREIIAYTDLSISREGA